MSVEAALQAAFEGPERKKLKIHGHEFNIKLMEIVREGTQTRAHGQISHHLTGMNDDQVFYDIVVDNREVTKIDRKVEKGGFAQIWAIIAPIIGTATGQQWLNSAQIKETIEKAEGLLNGSWLGVADYLIGIFAVKLAAGYSLGQMSQALSGSPPEPAGSGGAAPASHADKWDPRYDAVWEQAAPQDTWVRGWAPEHYAKSFDDLSAQGFRIVTQQAYDIGGGQIRYDAVWRKGSPEQTWVRGWAPEHYIPKLKEMLAQGWRVVVQQAYDIGGGQIRYDAIWQKGGPEQTWVQGWAPEHYIPKLKEMLAQGWRVVVQQAYDIGGQIRYDAVWRKGGAPQDFVLGWAEPDYSKKWAEMNANGWRIIAQQVYDID